MISFDKKKPAPGLYKNLLMSEYHSSNAVSNSDLQLIQKNPANYIWSKTAPSDFSKRSASDVGTAIHIGILEPERTDEFLIGPTLGRDTKKFTDFCMENPGKICLTQGEFDTVRLTVDSALAHPTAMKFIGAKGDCETSIFWKDERGFMCKIRPDKDLTAGGSKLLVDIKKTRSIAEWKSRLTWKNPLFTLNYGHNAAYYLKGASSHYKENYDEYIFLVIQTTAELGRFPIACFSINRFELEQNLFFDSVEKNLETYHECLKLNKWDFVDYFPDFGGENEYEKIEVEYED